MVQIQPFPTFCTCLHHKRPPDGKCLIGLPALPWTEPAAGHMCDKGTDETEADAVRWPDTDVHAPEAAVHAGVRHGPHR